MKAKQIIIIILLVLFCVFTIQNTEIVTIKFLTFEMSMSRVLVILGCFLIGLFSGILFTYNRKRKQ
jgi:uncharacterized integral membrane protein